MQKNSDRTRIAALRVLVTKIMNDRERARHKASDTKVPVGWPVYDEKEVMGALEALLALDLSQGKRVKKFEEQFAKYIGKKYAVAVNSGSSANLLALNTLVQAGKLKAGDEVILPATTFATVASPVLQLGLIPVYVDADPYSWNLDPKEVEKAISKKTKVILAVHTLGNPADMHALMRIAKKHKLILFEDCCEAHGASINKKKVGSFGDISTLSFFVSHNITTGEGGMVFTDDLETYELMRSIREFGRMAKSGVPFKDRFAYKDKHLGNYDLQYVFARLGYNMRMTDIEAALGLAQLPKLDMFNRRRNANVRKYINALTPFEKYIQGPSVMRDHFHSYYGFPFVIRENAPFTRMQLAEHLEERGIETRPFLGGSLPDQPGFRNEPKRVIGKLPVAKYLCNNSVFIGCHSELTAKQIAHTIGAFQSFFRNFTEK